MTIALEGDDSKANEILLEDNTNFSVTGGSQQEGKIRTHIGTKMQDGNLFRFSLC